MCAGLGCPYCCLQRHAGARVVARDQSLLRVLAFDDAACVSMGKQKASVINTLALLKSTLSGLYSRGNKLRDTLPHITRS